MPVQAATPSLKSDRTALVGKANMPKELARQNGDFRFVYIEWEDSLGGSSEWGTRRRQTFSLNNFIRGLAYLWRERLQGKSPSPDAVVPEL